MFEIDFDFEPDFTSHYFELISIPMWENMPGYV